ncbi:hypothetical protein D9M69_526440 [compost metagenome]
MNIDLQLLLCRLAKQGLAVSQAVLLSGPHVLAKYVNPQRRTPHARLTEQFKRVVVHNGWPHAGLAGELGASAAWILAMHAWSDLRFLLDCRDGLSAAVSAKVGQRWQLAYLDDRIRIIFGELQRYGTHQCSDAVEARLIVATEQLDDLEYRRAPIPANLAFEQPDCRHRRVLLC